MDHFIQTNLLTFFYLALLIYLRSCQHLSWNGVAKTIWGVLKRFYLLFISHHQIGRTLPLYHSFHILFSLFKSMFFPWFTIFVSIDILLHIPSLSIILPIFMFIALVILVFRWSRALPLFVVLLDGDFCCKIADLVLIFSIKIDWRKWSFNNLLLSYSTGLFLRQ